jgi:enoyl-CoA hydratase
LGKLEVEISNGVGWIYISNELRRNAIDEDIMNQFSVVLDRLREDNQVKVVVITGSGKRSFCSGGDLSVFHQLHTESQAYSMLSKMSENLYKLFTFPKPTIALLNGVAVGGGCEIAAACDIRVSVDHSRCGFIQGTLGITTGWGGATYLFEKLPRDNALFLLASGELVSAEKAKILGFIQETFAEESLYEQFSEWIKPFVQKSIPVLQSYKARLLDSYNLESIRERIDKEVRHCAILWESDEHHNHVQAFLTKSQEHSE